MFFTIAGQTDKGIVKATNQDALTVKRINTNQGEMVFAAVCDGMGGLAMGEVASTAMINAFNRWIMNELSLLCQREITEEEIMKQWSELVEQQNEHIKQYGNANGIRLGTTAVAMLFTQNKYFLMNVGDSRAYRINEGIRQLTKDQTFVAREIEAGRMTPEEAKRDERRNVLLQCIGASEKVYPDFFFEEIKQDEIDMLCSDGFRHVISEDEIFAEFRPEVLENQTFMNNNALKLITLNKERMERDNISVVLIKTS